MCFIETGCELTEVADGTRWLGVRSGDLSCGRTAGDDERDAGDVGDLLRGEKCVAEGEGVLPGERLVAAGLVVTEVREDMLMR